jgi:hypothetical protein
MLLSSRVLVALGLVALVLNASGCAGDDSVSPAPVHDDTPREEEEEEKEPWNPCSNFDGRQTECFTQEELANRTTCSSGQKDGGGGASGEGSLVSAGGAAGAPGGGGAAGATTDKPSTDPPLTCPAPSCLVYQSFGQFLDAAPEQRGNQCCYAVEVYCG